MLHIAELTYPGMAIGSRSDVVYREIGWRINPLMFELERSLAEAALALSLFEQEQQRELTLPSSNPWGFDIKRRDELEKQIAQEGGLDLADLEAYDQVKYLAMVTAKRERWKSGHLPEQYRRQLVYIYSKAFLHVLDRIERIVAVLAEIDGLPENVRQSIRDSHADFNADLPDLRGVRNSGAHAEDRLRGLRERERPLVPEPIENEFVHAPGGGIMLENLFNDGFISTMADGRHGEVKATAESLKAAQNCIQKIIDSFPWRGLKRHSPH